MEEVVVYTIPGAPIPLQRPRHYVNRVYDAQKNHKLIIGINLTNQHGDRPLYNGPLLLNATFYMPLAKTREKQKEKLLGTPDFYKPDIDNLIKMVLDCANKILYNDDAQITAIITKKIYGDPPRTEFTLRTLKDHYKGDFKTLKRIK